MTLTELLTTLERCDAQIAKRAKDIRTSLRYLAEALGHASRETCSVDAALTEETTWRPRLDAYFATLDREIGATTRKNTRNNLRVFFRAAEKHGLLTAPLPSRLLGRQPRDAFRIQQAATSPYRTTYENREPYALPQADWPQEIKDGWRAYEAACGLSLRATTWRIYRMLLSTYLGYLAHIEEPGIKARRTPTWDDCFDVAQLTAFVRWHGTRRGRAVTVQGRRLVAMVSAMAHRLEHPQVNAITELLAGIDPPAPMHKKQQYHWVSLAELEAVAEACLTEGRVPIPKVGKGREAKYPKLYRALRFQLGVMLKILVRIPLRQRNLRELQWDQHLYLDHAGHWQLHLQGPDLKIGKRRGGVVNEYKRDLTTYCPDLLPVLKEWRDSYRPKLRNAATSPFCFLTRGGRPFTTRALSRELSCVVAMQTGRRFYPHLIRTIWTTEYLEAKETRGDVTGAADALGDTVRMVLTAYHEILSKDQHIKQAAFLAEAIKPKEQAS